MLAFILVVTMAGQDYVPQSWHADGAQACAMEAQRLRDSGTLARCEAIIDPPSAS